MRTVGPELLQYLREVSLNEPEIVGELRQASGQLAEAGWEAAPEQGQFLAFLVRITAARRILEIGTFTGYATLWMALALPTDGKIVTLDMIDDYTNVGEPFWQRAGIRDKIDLRLAPAIDSLDALIDEGGAESFDFAFLDCNKKDYDCYYERALTLIRPGGLIALDNMFWDGKVIDPANDEKSTRALRALAKKMLNDDRVTISMLPLDDGLSLAWKH